MDTDMEITVVSLPDREKLVAEIYYRSHQWAEISQEGECLMLEIYANPEGGVWKFSFEDVLEALNLAKRKLLGEVTSDKLEG